MAFANVAGGALSPSYFPTLRVTGEPFIAVGLDSSSLHAWSGSPAPVLAVTAENGLPLAASFSITTTGGATLAATHPDAYSRVGVIDSGTTLRFLGHLPGTPPGTATVTFSIVDTKALAVNLFLPATPASTLNGLVAALGKGPGAAVLFELKREVTNALEGKESKIILIRNVSKLLIKFGVGREDRKWLLDNLKVTSLGLALWAKDVAQAAGAYAGLAHAGVAGTEAATLGAANALSVGPDQLAGDWSGPVHQNGAAVTDFTVDIALVKPVTSTVGSLVIPDIPCQGTLAYQAVAGQTTTFASRITSGNCLPGTVKLRLLTPTSVAYTWDGTYSNGSAAHSAGTLVRTS